MSTNRLLGVDPLGVTPHNTVERNRRRAGEHGYRAAASLQAFDHLVRQLSTPDGWHAPEYVLQHLAGQAWANARLAMHYALVAAAAAGENVAVTSDVRGERP